METNLLFYLAQQQPTPVVTQPAPTGTPTTAPAAAPKDAGSSMWMTGLMFGAVFIGMYFLVIRPQRKEEKRKKELLTKMAKGDRVVTSSGILGTVHAVKDETVTLNVGDGTRIEFIRSAVNEIRDRTETKPGAKKA